MTYSGLLLSSAREWRMRIEELSSAIDLQKQVLRDLETSRINARRDLNAICDPGKVAA